MHGHKTVLCNVQTISRSTWIAVESTAICFYAPVLAQHHVASFSSRKATKPKTKSTLIAVEKKAMPSVSIPLRPPSCCRRVTESVVFNPKVHPTRFNPPVLQPNQFHTLDPRKKSCKDPTSQENSLADLEANVMMSVFGQKHLLSHNQ